MGLGKTIQVLALLQTINEQPKGSAQKTPSLLVAPASFERLREIGEAIASRQEKLFVFPQFKAIIPSRLACGSFRSLVESGGRESSDRSRLSHWPKA